MTTWPEEGSSSDEFEFYDPTAPSGDDGLDTGVAERSDVDRDGNEDRDGAPTGEGVDAMSVDDLRKVIDVTFDDAKHVVDVRVSNRWRERVKRHRTTLAEVLLRVVNGNQALATAPLWQPPTVENASASPLNSAALDRLLEQSVTLDERSEELQAKGGARPTTFKGEGAEGWSANRKVRVTIDLHARTKKIDIDDEWVKQSRTDQTGEAILQAHQDAYAQWSPPEVEPGEWDLLHGERIAIRDEIMAMFRNGI